MTFLKLTKNTSTKIGKRIQSFFREEIIRQKNSLLKTLYQLLAESTKGGKYIRGTLVIVGYSLLQEKLNQSIFDTAAAYEILHTSLLIHDDIIDKSDTRRGEKSLWNKVGIDQAICLGDAGFFLSQKIIAKSTFSSERKTRATSLVSRIILDTISGEMLDVALSQKNTTRNEKDVITIHALKTAQYSIAGPLMLGALLGGADNKLLKRLESFGRCLGIAFQIQDDILGTFGDEGQLGKSVTSDVEENKNTLLISYALHRVNPQQEKIINRLYGKKITLKQLTELKNIFQETGSLSYSQKNAKDYVRKAKSMVPEITKNKTYQQLLCQLADFIVERSK